LAQGAEEGACSGRSGTSNVSSSFARQESRFRRNAFLHSNRKLTSIFDIGSTGGRRDDDRSSKDPPRQLQERECRQDQVSMVSLLFSNLVRCILISLTLSLLNFILRRCSGDSPGLFKERWEKLFEDWVGVKQEKFDPSRVSLKFLCPFVLSSFVADLHLSSSQTGLGTLRLSQVRLASQPSLPLLHL